MGSAGGEAGKAVGAGWPVKAARRRPPRERNRSLRPSLQALPGGWVLLCALLCAGCDAEPVLVQGSPWLWLALPLVGLVALEGLVILSGGGRPARRTTAGGLSQRPRRDRRQTLLLWALLLAILAALVFAGLNWSAGIEPATKLRNVGLWFLGTLLGSAGALALAWRVGTISDSAVPPGDESNATRMEIRDA